MSRSRSPRNVTFVEINIFDKMVPLVSGYLQAYASADPRLLETCRFRKYTSTVNVAVSHMADELVAHDSDVYAFSCYLWNMGVVKKLVRRLIGARPNAHIMLGGPQVMRHGEMYLDPSVERLVLCNGEGERTFARYLRETDEPEPDLGRVRGISFYRDGKLITTEPEVRIDSLDEIPSPYLSGVFDGDYRMAVMETNRGCPFRCNFCYWGAATNDRVYKFGEDRIRQEITWLSDNGVPLLYLADANWGMLKRDITIARHIAACKQSSGIPFYVYFAAAKNSPDRVAEIAEIFSGAGLLNTQPISMQSLDARSLAQVDRTNIKISAYETLQEGLNEKGISSYIELIWPLPGETLASFRKGIESLCELGAAHIIAYPHMLLHNTPLYQKKDQYGLVTRTMSDDAAEAELVIETADVSYEEFTDGLRFFYAVLAIYNTHALHRLAAWLHDTGRASYATLLRAFADFIRQDSGGQFGRFCERSIEDADYYQVVNYPTVYHLVLHAARDEFDRLLHAFASSQSWWDEERARFLFEVDLLAKPYLYANTPVRTPAVPLEHVRVTGTPDRSCLLEIPAHAVPWLREPVTNAHRDGPLTITLDHRRGQYPYRESQSREENASYCSGAVMRIANILPTWTCEQEIVEPTP